MKTPLPIDALLPLLQTSLQPTDHGPRNLVITAEPGAGKTTRVPPALLDGGFAREGQIVVLEPRRMAARLAARRVAQELGETVGGLVGYEVRYERKVSAATRIRFVTEGVLLRQLVGNPSLSGVAVVIADEVHERHLAGDVVLARVRALQRTTRPELVVIAMSATLQADALATFLGDCPVLRSEGRAYPVSLEHAPTPSEWPLEKQISAAVRKLVADGLDGDVLVFLPGAAEIRRATRACADIAAKADLLVVALHGDLPAAEQDRAIAPAAHRKVILSTNVAESSVTIQGVVAVVDSGLVRVARHSPWTGLPTLRVEPISQASATQRAGRAGRTGPGRCVRLYTEHDLRGRREHDVPELLRADLADLTLGLRAASLRIADLQWLDAPPEPAVSAAEELLGRLGATGDDGELTATGRRMLRFALHPRTARMLVEAERRGVAADGCTVAALASEREIRASRRGLHGAEKVADSTGPSDLLEDLALMDEARSSGRLRRDDLRRRGLEPAAVFAVDRARTQLMRRVDCSVAAPRDVDEALLISILTGFLDRIGRRRSPGKRELTFSGGGGGALSPMSVVHDANFMACVRAVQRGVGRSRAEVTSASRVDPDWLIELFMDRVDDSSRLEWNAEAERVEHVSRIEYDGLTLEETRDLHRARTDPEAAGVVLAAAVRDAGPRAFVDPAAIDSWRRRMAFARAHDESLPELDDDGVLDAIAAACPGRTSFAELRTLEVGDLLRGGLNGAQLVSLGRLAPTHIQLPKRRRVPVHYEDDRAPWIESRLQDFFGLAEGPRVASGRVPLVLHLLAPNRRAVQVTTDLAGFWVNHYPGIRKTLMRRYPRHAWPESPRARSM